MNIQLSALRKIIHCDCDCFYAAVEMRDDPALQYLPVAIGGSSRRRGVIATCNYMARALGVKAAMPTAQALRCCPDLVLLPPNMDKYKTAAKSIRAIFGHYTDLVEPLSLDEAYLDVSNAEHCGGSATLIGRDIQARIAREIGITASVGVAPNKFLAKIASDWRKPNGMFVVRPDQVDAFVRHLPVRKLHGVGSVTEARLQRLGIEDCAQLREYPLTALIEKFGSFGKYLHDLSWGRDSRPVTPERQRKSLSVEHTFASDLPDRDTCVTQIARLYLKLHDRLQRIDGQYRIIGEFVKVRFDDYATTTIESRCSESIDVHSYQALCKQAWRRRQRPVRLLGVGVRLTSQEGMHNMEQISLGF